MYIDIPFNILYIKRVKQFPNFMNNYSNDLYKAILNAETDLVEYQLLTGNHRKPTQHQTIQKITISQDGAIRRHSLLNDF